MRFDLCSIMTCIIRNRECVALLNLSAVFCDLSSVHRKAACYNSLCLSLPCGFENLHAPAPDLTFKVVNEVCS